MPSKLCPHVLAPTPDMRLFVEAGCPVVKLVSVFGPAEELLALRPDLTLVGRVYEDVDPNQQARSGLSPEAAARALMDRQKEQYRLNPLIKIWEGPNEPVFGNADDPANMQAMAWYAAFEAERLRLLADMGLRGVVGNFATGTPDLSMWVAFLPALDAAEHFHGFLGLHEYSSPWMWWLTGNYQTSNCDNRPDFRGEGDTGWLTLRYRKVYREYLAPNGFDDVPLIITECGLDDTHIVCPGQSSGPWRTHFGFWGGYDGARDPIDYWRGPQKDMERYYAEQLIWYDGELQKDDYVLGATIFTVGTLGGWQSFDIAGTRVPQFLADHIRAQRPAAPVKTTEAAPSGPQPTPVVTPPKAEPAPPAPPTNLIANGGFETPGGGAGAANWSPWWNEAARPADGSFNYAFKPTWNVESLSRGAARALIYAGNSSQRIINNWDPWWAGVKQVVTAPAGSRVRLTAYGRVWASNGDWPSPSDRSVGTSLRVGLEPNGSEDPSASTIVWSEPITPHDAWQPASVEVTVGSSGQVGVFLSANFRGFSRKFLASFWDEASLVVAPAPVVTPPAEPATIVVPPGPDATRPQPRRNILINASFEEGLAYFNDDTRELAVPAGWVFSFNDASTPMEARQTAPWGRPITALINSANVTPEDRARVFAGGVYCWKISGTSSPVWVRLFQSVMGLQAGQRYRFTVHILPDLILRTHPQAAYASDPRSGEVRLTSQFAERLFDSGWKNGREAPFGRYMALTLDFVAPSQRVEAALEVRGRWALPGGAWYIDELSLAPV